MINSQQWGNTGLRFLIENEIIFFFIQFPLVAFNQSFEMMPFMVREADLSYMYREYGKFSIERMREWSES